MDNTSGILRFFQSICRFNFGNFEKEEFKKFIRMGIIFALMIGVYEPIRNVVQKICGIFRALFAPLFL
jgi:AAA family ATP:ADP antiporter